MNKIYFSALALIALLSGCAASGPKMAEIKDRIPPLAADKGRIYFYRADSIMGAALRPEIHLDGEVVGNSIPGGFFFVDKAPGQYEAATSTEVTKSVPVKLEAGKDRHVRTSISMGVLVGHVTPELMAPEQAELDMSKLAYTGKPELLLAAGTKAPTQAAPAAPAAAVEANAPAAVSTSALNPASAPAAVVAQPVATPQAVSMDSSIQSDNELKLGTWSYDAEKLANQQGCVSNGSGAWLIGKQDINETYRIRCADGGKFLVVCDRSGCRAI